MRHLYNMTPAQYEMAIVQHMVMDAESVARMRQLLDPSDTEIRESFQDNQDYASFYLQAFGPTPGQNERMYSQYTRGLITRSAYLSYCIQRKAWLLAAEVLKMEHDATMPVLP